jgi:hypothetical protein
VVHVRPPFLAVHCHRAGPRSIALPDKWSTYNLATGEWAVQDATNLRFTAVDGSTHLFLIGVKEELEHLLAQNPADLLRIDHLPERPQNVRFDTANFDVPIMKLDEWMEGGSADEVADEWLLRPKFIEQDDQPDGVSEKSGKRRRRRGRRANGDRTGTEEPTMARGESPSGDDDFGDLGLSVVFRRRE